MSKHIRVKLKHQSRLANAPSGVVVEFGQIEEHVVWNRRGRAYYIPQQQYEIGREKRLRNGSDESLKITFSHVHGKLPQLEFTHRFW